METARIPKNASSVSGSQRHDFSRELGVSPASALSATKKNQAKRDRDLELMIAAQRPVGTYQQYQRTNEGQAVKSMITRAAGGMQLALAVALGITAMVIMIQDCCGDSWRWMSEHQFQETCRATLTDDAMSCFQRNVSGLITGSFALLLFVIGITVIVAGEMCFSRAGEKRRQENDLQEMAHEMRVMDLERRQDERDERRFIKESKALERSQRKQELKESKKLALEKERSRYGGARPFYQARSHSVGAPATIRVTPSAAGLSNLQASAPLGSSTTTYTTYTTQAPSNNMGNFNTYYTQQAQPQQIVVQPGVSYQYGRRAAGQPEVIVRPAANRTVYGAQAVI